MLAAGRADGAAPGVRRSAVPGDAVVAAPDPRSTALLRDAVRRVFPRLQVHLAATPDELQGRLSALRPELVVADLNLLDYSPRDFVGLARGLNPRVRLLVVAGHGDDDRVLPALRAGVAGFLLKYDPIEEIAAHLRSAMSGVLPLTPALARQLIRDADRYGTATALGRADREMLAWIAAGDSLAQAAERMRIGGDEILRQVDRILARTGLLLEAAPAGAGGDERSPS